MSVRTITLRTGTLLAVATLAGLPLAGVATAAPAADKDCKDYSSRADAQAALDADPTDPNGLDADDDGLACEEFGYGSPGGGAQAPVTAEPSTGSPGSGSSGGGSSASASSGDGGDITAVPSGSVDAGDGSATATGPGAENVGPLVLVGFGAVAAAGAGVTVWRTRRQGSARPGSRG